MTPSITEAEASAVAMDAAGPLTNADGDPTTGATTIWSSILQSVASSKMVFTKNVLVLGDPSSGKSALIHNLKRDHKEVLTPPGTNSVSVGTSTGTGTTTLGMNTSSSHDAAMKDKSELALSYTYADVKDDENEDTVGRLGFYQLSASHPTLFRFALNPHTFSDTLILITVDWQRPWTFVETLERWFSVIRDGVQAVRDEGRDASVNWSKGGVIVDENKERLERFLQEYVEPSEDGTLPLNVTTNANEVLLPLSEGSLTTNFGIPVIVVCCKADHMNVLEKEHDYKEDQFDFIQQTLRTICSYYGAGLFYTSTHRPKTFALLRAYLLNRLTYSNGINNTNATALMSARFPFPYRAQVVDRDIIMIPAGWDSWGKIQILRDGFDCRQMADAWEMDEAKDQHKGENGLHTLYQGQVRDMTAAIKSVVVKEAEEAEDEQEFLGKHIEVLRRVPTTNAPAQAPTTPTSTGATPPAPSSDSAATSPLLSGSMLNRNTEARATDVSPTNSNSSSRNGEAPAHATSEYLNRLVQMAQSRGGNTPTTPNASALGAAGGINGVGGINAGAAAAAAAAGAGPGAAAGANVSPSSQNEVLARFFKSLLDKKGAGGSSTTTSTGAPSGSSTSSSSSTRRPPHPRPPADEAQ
ncbi:dynein light intermediate chain-domain-containing protein [Syncephalis fuscata]|nr:dynein light intermediate chain-domain-containing protein [Syncephalis fuscata]